VGGTLPVRQRRQKLTSRHIQSMKRQAKAAAATAASAASTATKHRAKAESALKKRALRVIGGGGLAADPRSAMAALAATAGGYSQGGGSALAAFAALRQGQGAGGGGAASKVGAGALSNRQLKAGQRKLGTGVAAAAGLAKSSSSSSSSGLGGFAALSAALGKPRG